MSIIDDLIKLRQEWTTGPCGQSSSVLKRRQEARQALDGAIDEIKRLTEECSRLRMKCGPDEMTEGEYYTLAKLEEDNERLRSELSDMKLLAFTDANAYRLWRYQRQKGCEG